VPADRYYHVARAFFGNGQRAQLHGQDFPEVFWIEAGRGTHLVNDQRVALEPGDTVLMRPRDVHGLTARGRDGMTFVNIAFHANHLARLKRRYYQREAWPWAGGDLPATVRLSASRISQLSRFAEDMQAQGQSALALDRFLLNLLALLEPHGAAGDLNQHDMPGWLARGTRRFAGDRDAIRIGIPALARHCAKSREHVSRTVRSCMGCSATEWITTIRLDLAEADLRLSDKSILDVAIDCGMPNLANFYLRFKQRFGVTPRRYRLGARALVG
jgi:AraC family cel operon transcriptional repressor